MRLPRDLCRHLQFVLVAMMLCVLAACSSTDISAATNPHAAGDFAAAATAARELDADDDADGIWILLEQGKILMDAGDFGGASAAFTQCSERMDAAFEAMGDEGASVSGIAAVGANTLGDDRGLQYVGTVYDTVLLEAYAALSALAAGDTARAQACITRMHERQEEAISQHEKRLAAVQVAAAEGAKKLEGVEMTPKGKDKKALKGEALVSALDADAEESWKGLRAVGARKPGHTLVPYALCVEAIVARAAGNTGAVQESLKTLSSTSPASAEAAQNLSVALGGTKPVTVVLFENGRSAWREERRFGATLMKGIPIATLRSQPAHERARGLDVTGAGGAKLLCDVDELRYLEFSESLPAMKGRAITAWITKEVMMVAGAAMAGSDNNNSSYAGFALLLAGAISQAAAGADLRTWDALPAECCVLAVPTPADGKLTVRSLGNAPQQATCTVVPGKMNIVLVRSTVAGKVAVYSFAVGAGVPKS